MRIITENNMKFDHLMLMRIWVEKMCLTLIKIISHFKNPNGPKMGFFLFMQTIISFFAKCDLDKFSSVSPIYLKAQSVWNSITEQKVIYVGIETHSWVAHTHILKIQKDIFLHISSLTHSHWQNPNW